MSQDLSYALTIMKKTIQYGSRNLSLTVADERVVGVLSPRNVKPLGDVRNAVRSALRKPIKSRPLADILKGRESALIATVDHTRPSPVDMILPVLEECDRQGVRPTIIVATGRHRQMKKTELLQHFGRDILSRYKIVQHDPFDDSRMVTKGRTKLGTRIRVNRIVLEHDVVIGAGIIEPSYLCGWSGGRKIIMPGLAYHESIDNNHFYLNHPDTRIGRLHGNPLSDDSAEFASHLPLHFIVYSVVGPGDEVCRIVAGHRTKAHEFGCSESEKIYRARVKKADIVISSAGGSPYDCDLVQGKKAIIPAIDAVKRNGVIIICSECPQGLGAEKTFTDWLRNKTPVEVTRDVLDRKQFSLGAHGANILARPIVEKNAKVILVTCPDIARKLKGTYVTATTRLSDAWKAANVIAGTDSKVLFIEKARRLIPT